MTLTAMIPWSTTCYCEPWTDFTHRRTDTPDSMTNTSNLIYLPSRYLVKYYLIFSYRLTVKRFKKVRMMMMMTMMMMMIVVIVTM